MRDSSQGNGGCWHVPCPEQPERSYWRRAAMPTATKHSIFDELRRSGPWSALELAKRLVSSSAAALARRRMMLRRRPHRLISIHAQFARRWLRARQSRIPILELHPDAQVETEIAVHGHRAAGLGLGILQVIPDERDVQVQMALDFELQGGHRVVGI